MPYKSSKLPNCLDCGKQLTNAGVLRCRDCWRKAPKPPRPPRGHRPNDVRIDGPDAYLALTDRAGNVVAEVVVDRHVLPLVACYRWSYSGGYAACTVSRGGTNRKVLMHRLICGLDHGDPRMPDHIDRCGLNNRRSNLRISDTPLNAGNRSRPSSSRYPGVTWDKRNRRWVAQARKGGQFVWLGRYAAEEEAAAAYRTWREREGLPPLIDPTGATRRVDEAPKAVRPAKPFTSRYVGVKRCKQTGRWSVSFQENGRTVWLGRHDSEAEAARVATEWRQARGLPTLRVVDHLAESPPATAGTSSVPTSDRPGTP